MRYASAFFATCALAFAGTAAAGAEHYTYASSEVRPGFSESEILARLGEPDDSKIMQDGGHVLIWFHTPAATQGAPVGRPISILIGRDGRMQRIVTETTTAMR